MQPVIIMDGIVHVTRSFYLIDTLYIQLLFIKLTTIEIGNLYTHLVSMLSNICNVDRDDINIGT